MGQTEDRQKKLENVEKDVHNDPIPALTRIMKLIASDQSSPNSKLRTCDGAILVATQQHLVYFIELATTCNKNIRRHSLLLNRCTAMACMFSDFIELLIAENLEASK